VICAFQLCLSLVIRSFAVPVGIALIGGILGLVAMAKGYGVWGMVPSYCVHFRLQYISEYRNILKSVV
jgi:ABC-2 type transport system permease protein